MAGKFQRTNKNVFKGVERWCSGYEHLLASLSPGTHVEAHNFNSSFRASEALFWLLWCTGIHAGNTHTHTREKETAGGVHSGKRAGGMIPLVKHLPGRLEHLSSNLQNRHKKSGLMTPTYNPNNGRMGSQATLRIHRLTSLDYTSTLQVSEIPCLQQNL